MAVPVPTTYSSGFGATSSAVTRPASTASGDFLILHVQQDSATPTMPTPSGWALRLGPIDDTQTADSRHYLFTRKADLTTTDTPTLTASGSTEVAWHCARVTGADPTTPVHLTASATPASSSSQTGPTMTTTIAECLIVNFIGDDRSTAATAPLFSTTTTGWTKRDEPAATTSLQGRAIATYNATAAGAVTPIVWTQPSSDATAILQIAIAPESAPAYTSSPSLSGSGSLTTSTAGSASVAFSGDGTLTGSGVAATLVQGTWRWYADEATPSTALAAEETAPVLTGDQMRDGVVRLRVSVNSTNFTASNKVASLQYGYDGVNWNTVQEITPTLNQEGWWFRYANGASVAGTSISDSLLSTTTQSGKYHESGTTPTESISSNANLELDFALKVHWPPPDTTVLFRMVWDGTPLIAATPISLTTSTPRIRGRSIVRLDPDGSQKTTREIRFAPWPRLFYDGTYWWFFTVLANTPNIIRSYYWRGAGSDWVAGTTVDIGDASHQSRHAFAFKIVSGVPTVYVHAGASSSSRSVVRGTISGTTLTWGAVQTVAQASDRHRHITVTDGGYIWICGATAATGVWARRSTNTDSVTAWQTARTAADTGIASGDIVASMGLAGDKALLVWRSGTVLKYATVSETGGFSAVGQVNATTAAGPEDWGWARTGGKVYLVHSDATGSGGNWVLRIYDEAAGTWSTGASPGVSAQPTSNDGILVNVGDDGAVYAIGTFADSENGQDRKLRYVRYSGGTWGAITDVATSLGSRGNGDHIAGGIQGGGQIVIAQAWNDDDQPTHPRTAEFHTIPTKTQTLTYPARGAFYYAWFNETWTVGGQPTKWTPTLGNYDLDGSPADAIFDQHLTWAEYANLEFLVVSWWAQDDWNDNLTGTDHNEGTRVARLANRLTASGSPLKFCMYYESEGFGDPSVAQIKSDLAYIKDRYATHPNYLWKNGKPVIFVYNSGDTSAANMLQRWSDAGAFSSFYVVAKVFSGYSTATPAPSSWHQYGPASREATHAPYSHVVSPGYWQANDPDPPGTEFPYLARDTDTFSTAVANMTADSSVEWHLVTTFNEWGEGTNVEPSTQFGTTYLDILARNGESAPTDLAALSGSGSLGTASTPAVSRSTDLSGSGSLATVDVSAVDRSVPLAGSGSLSATTKPALSQTLALSGSGSLSTAGVSAVVRSVGLTGAGSLQASPALTVANVVSLGGSGTLSATGAASSTQVVTSITTQLYVGNTPLGSPTAHTLSTNPANVYAPFDLEFDVTGIDLAVLRSDSLNLRHIVTRGNSTETSIVYVDSAQLSIDYLSSSEQGNYSQDVDFSGIGSLSTVGVPKFSATTLLSGSGSLTTVVTPAPAVATGLAGQGSLSTTTAFVVTVSVGLSGSGSLSVAAAPRPTASVPLSGSGTLSGTQTFRPVQTVALSGTGALSTAIAPAVAVAVALSGSGSLTVTAAPQLVATVALSGTGILSAARVPSIAVTTQLSGNGSLSVTVSSTLAVGIPLSGSGSLTDTTTLTAVGAATFAGSGSLTTTTVLAPTVGVLFSGSGSLTVAVALATIASVALSGNGSISVAVVPALEVSAAFSGTGVLGVAPTTQVSVVVELSGSGALAVQRTFAPIQSVGLTGSGTLTVAAALTTVGTAGFSGTGSLIASTAGAGASLATLTGSGALSAQAVAIVVGVLGQLSGDGLLSVTVVPSAAGAVALEGAGSLAVQRALAISEIVVLSGSGELSFTTAQDRLETTNLSGVGYLTFAGQPTLAVAGALSGLGMLTAAVAPATAQAVLLSGSGTLVATGTAAVARAVALSGSGTLTVTAAPAPQRAVSLSGAGTLTLAVRPDLARTVALSGVGSLSILVTLRPAQTVLLSGQGTLVVQGRLQGIQTVVLSSTGQLSATTSSVSAVVAHLSGSGLLQVTDKVPNATLSVNLTGLGELDALEATLDPSVIVLLSSIGYLVAQPDEAVGFFSDDFERPGPELGNNWVTTGLVHPTIENGQVIGAAVPTASRWTNSAGVLTGTYSEFEYLGGDLVGPAVAMPMFPADAPLYSVGPFYAFIQRPGLPPALVRKDAGAATYTVLAETTAPRFEVGDMVKITYGNGTINIFINDVMIMIIAPPEPITDNRGVGFVNWSGANDGRPILDRWSGGNVLSDLVSTEFEGWGVPV